MSDRVFYVAAQNDEKRITGYVPAKFLKLNGKPVVDPTPGGSQNAYIYADGSDRYKTRGEIANPNNYLIVPSNYTEAQARAFAAEIANTMGQIYPGDETGAAGLSQALRWMTGAFLRNGPQDLQRHPQWGIPENSVVPAFTGSASYHLGSVTRWAGLPVEWSEIGGGIPNWINARGQQVLHPPVPRLGIYPKKIDANGPHGLSWHNYDDIEKGFADADVPRNGAPPASDFGYNAQNQYSPGQIGDGNGLGVGDWRFPFAGVDPSDPTRPVPPLQADSQPPPRLVRVLPNPSAAAPASPIASSDNRGFSRDRYANWGSVPGSISPLPASDRPESFDARFGNWGSVPAGAFDNTRSPVLRALERSRRSAAPDGAPSTSAPRAAPAMNLPSEESAPGDRSGNAPDTPSPDILYHLRRVSSAFPGIAPPNPDQPPPERRPALGIFSGKPMPSWSTPVPLGGLLNNSGGSGNNDLVNFLAGLAWRNPTQPEPAQQIADSMPERRPDRRTYSLSPASVFDTGAPAVPLVPSDDANYSGGLLSKFAALAGTDPNQPAEPSSDNEQEQADLQALEAKFSSSGNINDAWALYKARTASRR